MFDCTCTYLKIEIASDCAKLSESALYSSRSLSSARLQQR